MVCREIFELGWFKLWEKTFLASLVCCDTKFRALCNCSMFCYTKVLHGRQYAWAKRVYHPTAVHYLVRTAGQRAGHPRHSGSAAPTWLVRIRAIPQETFEFWRHRERSQCSHLIGCNAIIITFKFWRQRVRRFCAYFIGWYQSPHLSPPHPTYLSNLLHPTSFSTTCTSHCDRFRYQVFGLLHDSSGRSIISELTGTS